MMVEHPHPYGSGGFAGRQRTDRENLESPLIGHSAPHEKVAMSNEKKEFKGTKDGQQTEEKSLTGSAYTTGAAVQASTGSAKDLADADDNDD